MKGKVLSFLAVEKFFGHLIVCMVVCAVILEFN